MRKGAVVRRVDVEVAGLLAAVKEELAKHRTPEEVSREIGGISEGTVRNIQNGHTKTVRGPTLRALQAWQQRKGRPRGDFGGIVAGADPVAELVRQGQAEQAAWVLEFAARLLEAGAQRLRQGVQREAIISAVEATEAEITQPKAKRRRVSEG